MRKTILLGAALFAGCGSDAAQGESLSSSPTAALSNSVKQENPAARASVPPKRWLDIFGPTGAPAVPIPSERYARLKAEGGVVLYGRALSDVSEKSQVYEFVQGEEGRVQEYVARTQTSVTVTQREPANQPRRSARHEATRSLGDLMLHQATDTSGQPIPLLGSEPGELAITIVPTASRERVTCIEKPVEELAPGAANSYFVNDIDYSYAWTAPYSGDPDIDLYERIWWEPFAWQTGSHRGAGQNDNVEDVINSSVFDGDYQLKVKEYTGTQPTSFFLRFCGADVIRTP